MVKIADKLITNLGMRAVITNITRGFLLG